MPRKISAGSASLRSKLVPRELKSRGGFSVPFVEIRENTLRLNECLSDAASRLELEWTFGDNDDSRSVSTIPPALMDVQLYSRAVQVFSTMSVEAAMNAYGLMRFGAEQFGEYEKRRPGLRRKVLELLDHDRAGRPGDDEEIVKCVERLVRRRNALVHQHSDESTLDSTGALSYVTEINWPDVGVQSAAAAVADMEVFFADFPRRDIETAIFFLVRQRE